MINLAKLQLSKNVIVNIPNSICKLSNLVTLSLSSNAIKSFPEGIKNCTKL